MSKHFYIKEKKKTICFGLPHNYNIWVVRGTSYKLRIQK